MLRWLRGSLRAQKRADRWNELREERALYFSQLMTTVVSYCSTPDLLTNLRPASGMTESGGSVAFPLSVHI